MKLTVLAVLLGLGVVVPAIYGLLKPAAFAAALRKFPRSLPIGYLLMTLGTAWFIYYVQTESAADFEPYKNAMSLGFAAIGFGACVFLKDYLAVRGLAVVMLLLAKLMTDTARWVQTEWRLVIIVWAYAFVLGGMWFTISPWRLRDLINWLTANEKRLKTGCAIRLAFGLFVILLGLTAFRSVEAKEAEQSADWPISTLQAPQFEMTTHTAPPVADRCEPHVLNRVGCAEQRSQKQFV